MTLLSMLIALIVERLAVRGNAWQLLTYLQPYLAASRQGPLRQLASHPLLLVLWWLLPALLVALFIQLVQFWLFQLLLNTLVLLLCIGSWHYRQLYKQYLNAQARGDQEAAFLLIQQMNSEQGAPALNAPQQLVWLNFRYYAAVLFWYMLLGAFGAVAYACLRQLAEPRSTAAPEQPEPTAQSEPTAQATAQPDAAEQVVNRTTQSSAAGPSGAATTDSLAALWQQHASQCLHWADFIPVRLFGLGLALVGDFSRTSSELLQGAGDVQQDSCEFYTRLCTVAEPALQTAATDETAASGVHPAEQSVAAVQLAKRNILFFLALVAILTLGGWLA